MPTALTNSPNSPVRTEKDLAGRLLAFPRELVKRINDSRLLGIAAEMSFWLFLALVPLATVVGYVVAKLAVGSGSAMDSMLTSLPQEVRDLLTHEVGTVAAWRAQTVAPTAIATFLWLASSGIHAIFDAMEVQTGGARPWWKKRLIALGMCIVLPIGVALVAFLTTELTWMWHSSAGAVAPSAVQWISHSPIATLVRFTMGGLVALGLVCALFFVGVPPLARREMPVLPGAIVVVGLQMVLGYGYGFYISKFGTGGAYQAGLAVIGVTLIAIYLFSVALLVGLACNVMLRDHRRRAMRVPPSSASPPPAQAEEAKTT